MPKAVRYTKDEILDAACDLVRARGASALSARNLASALSTSPSPVFAAFSGMEAVLEGVVARAVEQLMNFPLEGEEDIPPTKRPGLRMVLFAAAEKQLFELLFLSGRFPGGTLDTLHIRADDGVGVRAGMAERYGLSLEEAEQLFSDIWIHTFGLAVLAARGGVELSQQEASKQLSRVFFALLSQIKGEEDELKRH